MYIGVNLGYIQIVKNKMETTAVIGITYRLYIGIIGNMFGSYWDNGKLEWNLLFRVRV